MTASPSTSMTAPDSRTPDLAAILSERLYELAATAREALSEIDADRHELVGDQPDAGGAQLVGTVNGKVEALAADCERQAAILERFATSQGGRAPARTAGPAARPGGEGGAVSEGTRLIATQMSVAGSSPAEIEHRLREEFRVSNADQVVRELFGSNGIRR